MDVSAILVSAETLKNILVARATGGATSEADFRRLRAELIGNAVIKDFVPRFVHTCRTLDEFWGFIKPKFASYHERREFLRAEFDKLLSWLERGAVSPVEDHGTAALAHVDLPHIHDAWHKALERCRTGDTDGALTAARMLIETVCKHILDDYGVTYPDDADLPKLYRLTSEKLTLAPSQHTEQVFKQILGGCTAAVEGLGAMRNRLSDAHGKGRASVRAAPRHAELALNLAGTVTTFLVATWEARKPPVPR
ncbi:hypothetical protein RAS1_08590 [Phycisphaerae bacterium RAS1]|nr:hypothetical protein RAS1_08590 [Phycisphaerae bacterium RAS1]